MKLDIDPEALLEIKAAAAFYEENHPGLGRDYLFAVEAAVEEVARHPLMWRRIKGRFRWYLLHRFPYALIYAVQGETIYVAAVMHLKRKPGYWLERTRGRR